MKATRTITTKDGKASTSKKFKITSIKRGDKVINKKGGK